MGIFASLFFRKTVSKTGMLKQRKGKWIAGEIYLLSNMNIISGRALASGV